MKMFILQPVLKNTIRQIATLSTGMTKSHVIGGEIYILPP